MNTPPQAFLPAKRRVHRKRREAPATVVSGPVLVLANYDAPVLTLVFDRAIDLSDFAFDQCAVLDGTVPVELDGTGDITPIDNGFMMTMIENAEYTGEGIKLSVPGGAGIKAADDGEPWAGCVELDLPFP